jgi:small subunit ribosomal protein S2
MAAPVVTMQQLIEAGAHFGHQTHRWNPRMKPYIFGARNGVHILDLSQTVPLFARALDFIDSTVRAGGKVLFVGTKRQAQDPIAQSARASGQHFVNHRWLGGMLTNWKTISNSIKRLKSLDEQLSGDMFGLTKKEVLQLTRERDKLELSLGGIRDMGGTPDVMFVIDANKEELAIKEANVLGIPVVAILDSNVSPDGIAFPVPANDDASRAIRLYCDAVAAAAKKGGHEAMVDSGVDIGALDVAPVEEAAVVESAPVAEEAAEAPVAEVSAEEFTAEAPAEEAVAEAPVEEAVAEAPAEEAVADAPAEEAVAEAPAEEAAAEESATEA